MDIRRYLFEHEMTMKQLAQKLEITPTHLAALKKKKRVPSVPLLIKIIDVTKGEVGPKDLIPEVFTAYENATRE